LSPRGCKKRGEDIKKGGGPPPKRGKPQKRALFWRENPEREVDPPKRRHQF